MKNMIRFYMSADAKDMEEIDQVVKDVNEGLESWRSHTNRQAIIRGLIKFALKQNLRFKSGYGKHVTVSRKKPVRIKK